MSILIKGMKMPEKQVCIILNPNGLVEVLDANNVLLEEYQAVPVPPHGRLIDADAPIDVWEVRLSAGDSCSFRNIETTVSKFLLSHLMGEVPPTIIEVEEG